MCRCEKNRWSMAWTSPNDSSPRQPSPQSNSRRLTAWPLSTRTSKALSRPGPPSTWRERLMDEAPSTRGNAPAFRRTRRLLTAVRAVTHRLLTAGGYTPTGAAVPRGRRPPRPAILSSRRTLLEDRVSVTNQLRRVAHFRQRLGDVLPVVPLPEQLAAPAALV